MINEGLDGVFSNFIHNSHFSTTLFKKNDVDEFYIKDDDYCFYFYRLGNTTFLILYDKETTIDDMINVKVNLKTFIDQFEDNEKIITNSKRK
jgi:hypothetical protein